MSVGFIFLQLTVVLLGLSLLRAVPPNFQAQLVSIGLVRHLADWHLSVLRELHAGPRSIVTTFMTALIICRALETRQATGSTASSLDASC